MFIFQHYLLLAKLQINLDLARPGVDRERAYLGNFLSREYPESNGRFLRRINFPASGVLFFWQRAAQLHVYVVQVAGFLNLRFAVGQGLGDLLVVVLSAFGSSGSGLRGVHVLVVGQSWNLGVLRVSLEVLFANGQKVVVDLELFVQVNAQLERRETLGQCLVRHWVGRQGILQRRVYGQSQGAGVHEFGVEKNFRELPFGRQLGERVAG